MPNHEDEERGDCAQRGHGAREQAATVVYTHIHPPGKEKGAVSPRATRTLCECEKFIEAGSVRGVQDNCRDGEDRVLVERALTFKLRESLNNERKRQRKLLAYERGRTRRRISAMSSRTHEQKGLLFVAGLAQPLRRDDAFDTSLGSDT